MTPTFCRALLLHLSLTSLGVLSYRTSLPLDDSWGHHQQCIDIGSAAKFQPSSQSSLIIKFDSGSSGVVSVVVFELGDEHLGGKHVPGSKQKKVICTTENVARGLCGTSQLGEFLISDMARQKAHRPFVTRAVNLSSPISIAYPIISSGFYCTAAVSFSAPSFSATMEVIDPSSGNQPAFRAGLLAVYRYLGLFWIAFATAWMFSVFETSAEVCWLVPFSIVQVALRWCALELGQQAGLAIGVKVLSNIVEASLDCVVLRHTHQLATTGYRKTTNLGCTYIFLAIFVIIFAALKVVDFHSTAASQAPAYFNLVLSITLTGYLTWCISKLLRTRYMTVDQNIYSQSPRHLSTTFSYALGFILLLVVAVVVVNAWCLLASRQPLEFGHAFWKTRFWIIDAPYEFIILFWILFVASYCQCNNRQHDHMMEMKSTQSDTELGEAFHESSSFEEGKFESEQV